MAAGSISDRGRQAVVAAGELDERLPRPRGELLAIVTHASRVQLRRGDEVVHTGDLMASTSTSPEPGLTVHDVPLAIECATWSVGGESWRSRVCITGTAGPATRTTP